MLTVNRKDIGLVTDQKKPQGSRRPKPRVLNLEDWGGQGQETPSPRPRITLKIRGQPVTFLVDTGAQHSVLTHTGGSLNDRTALVQGATGNRRYQRTTEKKVQLTSGQDPKGAPYKS